MRFANHTSRPAPVSNASACTSRGAEISAARSVRPDAAYIPRITCQAGNRPPCSSNQGLRRLARMMHQAVVAGRRTQD